MSGRRARALRKQARAENLWRPMNRADYRRFRRTRQTEASQEIEARRIQLRRNERREIIAANNMRILDGVRRDPITRFKRLVLA